MQHVVTCNVLCGFLTCNQFLGEGFDMFVLSFELLSGKSLLNASLCCSHMQQVSVSLDLCSAVVVLFIFVTFTPGVTGGLKSPQIRLKRLP